MRLVWEGEEVRELKGNLRLGIDLEEMGWKVLEVFQRPPTSTNGKRWEIQKIVGYIFRFYITPAWPTRTQG